MQGISTRTNTLYSTVTSSSQQVTLIYGNCYRFSPSIDTWIATGSNPTASAANGSTFVAAGRELYITPIAASEKAAVLRVGSSDGVCTFTAVMA